MSNSLQPCGLLCPGSSVHGILPSVLPKKQHWLDCSLTCGALRAVLSLLGWVIQEGLAPARWIKDKNSLRIKDFGSWTAVFVRSSFSMCPACFLEPHWCGRRSSAWQGCHMNWLTRSAWFPFFWYNIYLWMFNCTACLVWKALGFQRATCMLIFFFNI